MADYLKQENSNGFYKIYCSYKLSIIKHDSVKIGICIKDLI